MLFRDRARNAPGKSRNVENENMVRVQACMNSVRARLFVNVVLPFRTDFPTNTLSCRI